jgi:hypothetical protein
MAQSTPALTTRTGGGLDEVDRMSRRVGDLRVAIGRDVHELEGRLREAFDLRRQIARHPLVAAAIVFGGVLVATTIVRRLLRGVRTTGNTETRAVARARGRSGKREAQLKEAGR